MKQKKSIQTYYKALPQLPEQMTALGRSRFELFLFEYSADGQI